MTRDDKIMKRLHEHLDAVKHKYPDWVGIFLRGAQNYDLDDEDSDVDSVLITLPSFREFALHEKPVNYTYHMENDEHVDIKDFWLMLGYFKRQDLQFLEILFTKYYILNPRFEKEFQRILDAAEEIAHYDNYASINRMYGFILQKEEALCHPYPSTINKIKTYGFDGKQLSHAIRMLGLTKQWVNGAPYSECLKPEYFYLHAYDHKALIEIKRNRLYSKEDAKITMEWVKAQMAGIKSSYLSEHEKIIDTSIDSLFSNVFVDILQKNFAERLNYTPRDQSYIPMW